MAVIKVLKHYVQRDAVEIAAQFTLLTLLFAQVGNAFTRPFILLIAAISILLPYGYRQPHIWLALCFFTSFRVFYEWPMADNHAYLLAQWCMTLSIACFSQSTGRILANNARILIGLIFLLASIQKISAPDYLDGTFFRYLFLADNRFEDFVVLFGNISYQEIDNARGLLENARFSALTVSESIVPISTEFNLLVNFSTWWNLLDQIAVACCFLAPANSFLYKKRDFSLLIFCITTYAVAPVPGFGWLLVSMGLAQCGNNTRVRVAYICTFFIILFYYEVHLWGIFVDFL